MSNAPWSPPVGRLFVTTYTDPDHEQSCRLNCIDPATWKPPMHLRYRLTDEMRFPCAVVMQGSPKRAAWTTGPAEYVAIEDTEPARYVSETGIVIERRLATDDDLRAMFAAWRVHGFTLEQWLMSVRLPRWQRTDYAPIDVDDLQRMARIIAEVQQPVPPTAEEREAHRRDAAQATNELVRAMREAGASGARAAQAVYPDGWGEVQIGVRVVAQAMGVSEPTTVDEIARLLMQASLVIGHEGREAFCLDAARSTIERVRDMVGARHDEATTDAVARALRKEGSEG